MSRLILDLRNDRRQRADDTHCGAVTAAVLLDLCGVHPDESTDRVRRGLPVSHEGVHPATLGDFLLAQGCRLQSGSMTVADLRHHASQGRPVACLIRDHGGHWVVSLGVERRKVVVHDPYTGRREVPEKLWSPAWYDLDRFGCEFRQYAIACWR